MGNEAALLASLSSGPQPFGKLPLPKSTRYDVARRLERRGLLKRAAGKWQLTKEGWQHAMENYGIMPQPVHSIAYVTLEDTELSPAYTQAVDIVEWAAWAILVAVLLAAAGWLIGYLDLQGSVASWLLSIF